jgi:hypothetical protein
MQEAAVLKRYGILQSLCQINKDLATLIVCTLLWMADIHAEPCVHVPDGRPPDSRHWKGLHIAQRRHPVSR